MDALDREILSLLQQDGRATMTNVASKVGLSLSACHRRFRDLEASGVIRGFSIDLDLDLLGMPFEALVFVTMKAGDGTAVAAEASGETLLDLGFTTVSAGSLELGVAMGARGSTAASESADVVLLADDREGTADSVERLMGTKAEARFAFISDKAEFASDDLLDV